MTHSPFHSAFRPAFHPAPPLFSIQDILRAAVLILISLLFSFMPKIGYCQTPNTMPNTVPPPVPNTIPETMPEAAFLPISVPPAPVLPAAAAATPDHGNRTSEPAALLPPEITAPARAPEPAPAAAEPLTANPYRPETRRPETHTDRNIRTARAEEPKPPVISPAVSPVISPAGFPAALNSVAPSGLSAATSDAASAASSVASSAASEPPFAKYWGIPNNVPSKITGKPMKVAEIFAVRSAAARCRLLQSYWELAGLLAVYHFQCEAEQTAAGSPNEQQAAYYREQCRSAEIEFIKQQRQFAELWKQQTGRILRDSELPIPSDFPLHTHYKTYADQIAQSDRTKYLGQMIPIQEQLIETKKNTLSAAAGLPLVQQREAFCELTQSIVEYNKMIAEYALETIPPNVSRETLLGAVIRVPVTTINRPRGKIDN